MTLHSLDRLWKLLEWIWCWCLFLYSYDLRHCLSHPYSFFIEVWKALLLAFSIYLISLSITFLSHLFCLIGRWIKKYLNFFVCYFIFFRLVIFRNLLIRCLSLAINSFLVSLGYWKVNVIIQDFFLINQSIKILIILSRWFRNFNALFAKIIN